MVKVEAFQCFTNETYKLLQKLRKKKILNDEEYINFGECRNIKEVKDLLQKNFSIKETEIIPIWHYIIYKGWKWKRANKSESTVFNEPQNQFMKKLLSKNGIYERDQCLRDDLTNNQISIQIKQLEEMAFIVSFRTSKKCDNKTFFVINPEIIQTEIRATA